MNLTDSDWLLPITVTLHHCSRVYGGWMPNSRRLTLEAQCFQAIALHFNLSQLISRIGPAWLLIPFAVGHNGASKLEVSWSPCLISCCDIFFSANQFCRFYDNWAGINVLHWRFSYCLQTSSNYQHWGPAALLSLITPCKKSKSFSAIHWTGRERKQLCSNSVASRGEWGFNPSPPEIPKVLQNCAKLKPIVKTVKNAEFRTPEPQNVRKKGSKILKLPRFAIVLD